MKLHIEEKEMTIRVQVDIPQIDLVKFSEHNKGIFSGSMETPNKYTVNISNQNFIVMKKQIFAVIKPSIWSRIKGDFKQFLNDIEWEKFVVQDLEGIRQDIKKVRGAVK